ncbi:mechanosensitive ion channel protein MscS [Novimethylophilus kurashikiensis]|uniref:Small-conductance mechanosensitive channel n=1 Tax=Novimethylophilus kurashikiensis TaxID=1825523 RepID=A0A2R5F406_9PROT|nr:mechanosensitive ion channel family protein [Novimethylophilus kurashikiensis]GBG12779.1 mechanosensitive ion channel protein MscS [Novimethylophilus kurashikiensis]
MGNLITDALDSWDTASRFAWHDGLGSLLLLVAALSLLMLHYRPSDRRSLFSTLLMLAFGLIGQLGAGFVSTRGFPAMAEGLHEAFRILEGLAVIRIFGMFIFRMLPPLVHLTPPRILEDIIVFLAYIAWGFVRLHTAGLDLSGIVTTSAVITAVLAFSMQDTLGNILGGLSLQFDNSIQIGDWIKVDDIVGKVVDIRWRYTAIETRNWETVIVPNSQLMRGKFAVLGRYSDREVQWRRWVWFNVGYQVSPSRVIETVQKAIRSADIPNVSKSPEPNCVLMDFTDSYGRYAVRYWLTDLQLDDPTDSEVRDHIYAALQRADIRLAVPEHSIHMITETEKHEQARHIRRLQERIDALHKVELFNSLHADELRTIAEKLKYAPFAKGDIITRQGAVAHWLYMLTDGEADVYLETPGQERRKLNTLHPGNFFGEMGLMMGAPRTATVIAATDVECYQLDKASFQEVLEHRPEMAEEISKILVSRRYGLDSLQQMIDDDTRVSQMAQQHQDVLSRIYEFFGIKAGSK